MDTEREVEAAVEVEVAVEVAAPVEMQPAPGKQAGAEEFELEVELERQMRLWQAVLLAAIEDWRYGPLRVQRQAEHYLFEDNVDFPVVCNRAGLDAGRLRAKLGKLRTVRREAPMAA